LDADLRLQKLGGKFQAFWRIVLPLMRAPLFVVGAITFAQAYGQFVYPITLLSHAAAW